MGKRDVGHNFFIEPTTGVTHPLEWEEYHGIEVLWNHRNYWVNMQDCSHGVQVIIGNPFDAKFLAKKTECWLNCLTNETRLSFYAVSEE